MSMSTLSIFFLAIQLNLLYGKRSVRKKGHKGAKFRLGCFGTAITLDLSQFSIKYEEAIESLKQFFLNASG